MTTSSSRDAANRFAIRLTMGLLLGISLTALALSAGNGAVPHDDPTITRAVKERLEASPAVSGTSVTVTTADGVVTLTGSVGDRSEKRSSTELARHSGAVRVINRLEIERRESRPTEGATTPAGGG